MNNTYSLFILKPGFLDRLDELKNILTANDIKIDKEFKGVIPKNKIKMHYEEHEGKSFYDNLVNYMTNGDVKGIHKFNPTCIIMQVSSKLTESEEEFILRTRSLVKNLIRPKLSLKRENFYSLSDMDFEELIKTANVIHASDSPISAKREIDNLFSDYKNDKAVTL